MSASTQILSQQKPDITTRKRVLEYKLPTWGILILAVEAIASAFMAYIAFFFSFYTPALPSDIPRPVGIPLTQIIIMIYLAAVAILDLILAAGLLMHWNKARIITIILSPAPIIGVILGIIYQTWAHQLLTKGPPGSIMQLQPLNTIASLLLVTGVSFPSMAPLISTYTQVAVPSIILALLNIGAIIYLSNNHIKAQFKKLKPIQPPPTSNTPTTLSLATDTLPHFSAMSRFRLPEGTSPIMDRVEEASHKF